MNMEKISASLSSAVSAAKEEAQPQPNLRATIFSPGTVLRKNGTKSYYLYGLIGQGSQGQVYGALDLDPSPENSELVAVKVETVDKSVLQVNEEVSMKTLSNSKHPGREYIVKMIDQFVMYVDGVVVAEEEEQEQEGEKQEEQEKPEKFRVTVFELCDGDFDKFLKNGALRTERKLRKAIRQCLWGLACLEDSDILDSDLKPSNILVSFGRKGQEFIVKKLILKNKYGLQLNEDGEVELLDEEECAEELKFFPLEIFTDAEKRMFGRTSERENAAALLKQIHDEQQAFWQTSEEFCLKICDIGVGMTTITFKPPEFCINAEVGTEMVNFSFGCILYVMFAGQLLFNAHAPFLEEDGEQLATQIANTLVSGDRYVVAYLDRLEEDVFYVLRDAHHLAMLREILASEIAESENLPDPVSASQRTNARKDEKKAVMKQWDDARVFFKTLDESLEGYGTLKYTLAKMPNGMIWAGIQNSNILSAEKLDKMAKLIKAMINFHPSLRISVYEALESEYFLPNNGTQQDDEEVREVPGLLRVTRQPKTRNVTLEFESEEAAEKYINDQWYWGEELDKGHGIPVNAFDCKYKRLGCQKKLIQNGKLIFLKELHNHSKFKTQRKLKALTQKLMSTEKKPKRLFEQIQEFCQINGLKSRQPTMKQIYNWKQQL